MILPEKKCLTRKESHSSCCLVLRDLPTIVYRQIENYYRTKPFAETIFQLVSAFLKFRRFSSLKVTVPNTNVFTIDIRSNLERTVGAPFDVDRFLTAIFFGELFVA